VSESVDLAELAVDPESVGFLTRPDYVDVLHRLRRDAPVFEYAPGAWTLARYDDVRAVSRDPERFVSGRGVLMNDPKREGAELPGSILHMDPPEHGAWRRIASRWFTPRAVAGLSDRIHAIASGVLDELATGEEVDAVEAIAAPIPVLVIAELLGLGDGERDDFRRWSDACIEGADDDPDDAAAAEAMVAVGELLGFLTEHAVDRRTHPRDDLLTSLVHAEVEGRPLLDDEIVMYCLALLVAGNETTRHLISGAIAALDDHPAQRAGLVGADDDAWATAVEESLRWVTPIQTFARTAAVDVELGGATISEGDWVVLLYASANRDETVFGPTAGSFDVTRPPNPAHVAFGFGEHLCLGASLARLEARAALSQVVDRFPDLRVTGEPTWTRSTLVRGFASLPVALG
jgi:cytochrome P450